MEVAPVTQSPKLENLGELSQYYPPPDDHAKHITDTPGFEQFIM